MSPRPTSRPCPGFSAILILPALAAGFALGSCSPSDSPGGAADPGVEQAEGGGVVPVDAKSAAAHLTAHPETVILDIRTPGEFAAGHIPGARNVDFQGEDFEEKIADLDPAGSYLVHCRSGGRSAQAIPLFESLDFEHLWHLEKGFLDWEAAGLPVEP